MNEHDSIQNTIWNTSEKKSSRMRGTFTWKKYIFFFFFRIPYVRCEKPNEIWKQTMFFGLTEKPFQKHIFPKKKPCRYTMLPVCAYSSFFFREIEETKRFSVNSFMLTADDRLTCCDTHTTISICVYIVQTISFHLVFVECGITHTLIMLREVSTDNIQTWIRSLSYVYRNRGVAIILRRCAVCCVEEINFT